MLLQCSTYTQNRILWVEYNPTVLQVFSCIHSVQKELQLNINLNIITNQFGAHPRTSTENFNTDEQFLLCKTITVWTEFYDGSRILFSAIYPCSQFGLRINNCLRDFIGGVLSTNCISSKCKKKFSSLSSLFIFNVIRHFIFLGTI